MHVALTNFLAMLWSNTYGYNLLVFDIDASKYDLNILKINQCNLSIINRFVEMLNWKGDPCL
jgi:hypothetical protein